MILRSAAILAVLAAATASAGEFNQVLNIGDAAPAWEALPGVDGKTHSLADLPPKNFIVLVFTCNSCPVARDYEDRIMAFARAYKTNTTLVAVNVNTIAEDRLDQMQLRAKERNFNFPYLYDESQAIARTYGASGTPEFFLLSPAAAEGADEGASGRRILYMGAMDDDARAAEVKQHYLADALAAAVAGNKPPVAETFANGCRIRFARERRKRD